MNLITERKDSWLAEWLLMASALTVFLTYAGWATFQGKDYIAGPYRSPFYPFDIKIGNISPALFIFWIPVFFRLTCYYWRRVYYRSYLLDPITCAAEELRKNYSGERKFPFILLNFHRYFVYLAIILLIFHWKETVSSFFYKGKFGVGIGNMLILLDSIFLTVYVFSCHALRHLLGGGNKRFCGWFAKLKYYLWKNISILNEKHGVWAWISLITVILADLYVRFLSQGLIYDMNSWHIAF
jgi:hypothetical protein